MSEWRLGKAGLAIDRPNRRRSRDGGRGRRLASTALLLIASTSMLAASEPTRLEEATQSGGGVVVTFREDRAHVAVLELSGDYSYLGPGGDANVAARQAVAREFFETHSDSYDFLLVLTSFPVDLGADVRGRYLGVRNDVSGIGIELFDHSPGFGSDGRLQGFVDLGELDGYGIGGPTSELEKGLRVAAHELLHRWGAYVRHVGADGELRDDLATGGGHWSYLAQTSGSLLHGNHWRDEGDGTFRSLDAIKVASPLDLYLAGFLAPEDVPPFFLIRNPAVEPQRPPRIGDVIAGTRETIEIGDIVAAEGPRDPPSSAAQREFRSAIVYLVRPDEPIGDESWAELETLREELIARFAILTAGRGRLEIHPVGAGGPEPGGPGPIDGGPIRPGVADLADAGAWLASRQLPDGSWRDHAGTVARDTAAAVRALETAGRTFDLGAATSWAVAAAPASLDGQVRRAGILAALDRPAELLLARSSIGEAQNADGGWGAAALYGSDPLDTALALGANPVGHDDAAATSALLAAQNADGSWGSVSTGAGSLLATVEAVRALGARGESEAASAGLAWLESRQNADGGFGDSPSRAHTTAEALLLLREVDRLDSIDAGAAAGYLRARQTVEGSWEGSVYTTARVLEALLADQNPDWAVASELSAEPGAPTLGEAVELRVRVRNAGGSPLPAGLARFYDGDPANGGIAFGGDRAIPPLAAGGEFELFAEWPEAAPEGEHAIHLVVDPANLVPEADESNNHAVLAIQVGPAVEGPDLELRGEGISFVPAAPDRLPSTVTITVTLFNRGSDAVADARVRLWQGEPGSGAIVGELSVPVGAGASVPVHFPVELAIPGPVRFTAVADPDDAIAEAREENNQAWRDLATSPSHDLEVLAADLALLDPPYPGADVRFAVTIRNRGTLGTPGFEARYEIVADGEVVPVDAATLLLGPGAAANRTIPWRVSRSGALQFRVVLDPNGELPEIDESNNGAALAFVAGAPDVPNLAVSYLDLDFDPEPAREGSPLAISVLVRNTGGVAAPPFEVGFFDGDPDHGGTLIGTSDAGAIAPGAASIVGFAWNEPPDAGDRIVHVVADPGGELVELDESDNRAFRFLEVLSLPDAALSAASISVVPAFPVPGQPVAIYVEGTNLGEQPLAALAARVYLGDPGNGGVAVGPDLSFPVIPGGESRIAQLSFTFPVAEAAAEIVVLADPDGVIREGSELNNRAGISLAIQDSDLFLSERFISPNGDGIRDVTTLSFRLDAPATVRIEIRDRWGSLVRRATDAAWAEAVEGSFTWDGTTDLGRVARDGDLSLEVVAENGSVLGQAVVTVDTNRSSLADAASTPYEAFNNLTCAIPRPRGEIQLTADERSAFVLYDWGTPGQPVGIYRLDGSGGSLQTVLGPDWFDWQGPGDSPDRPSGFRVSESGALVAFSQSSCACGNCNFCGGTAPKKFLTTASGSSPRQLPLPGDSSILSFIDADRKILAIDGTAGALVTVATGAATPPVTLYDPEGYVSGGVLSPDRRRFLAFVAHPDGGRIDLVDLETGAGRVLLVSEPYVAQPIWSRDGAFVALYDAAAERILSISAAGDRIAELPVPASESEWAAPWAVFLLGYSSWNDELAIQVERGDECPLLSEFYSIELATGAATNLGVNGPRNCNMASAVSPGGRGTGDPGAGSWEATTGAAGTDAPSPRAMDTEEPSVWNRIGGPWIPNDRALLTGGDLYAAPLHAFRLDPGAEPRRLLEGWEQFHDPRLSPTGRRLLFESYDPSGDPESACYGTGPDTIAVKNWLNLGTELVARREPGVSGVLLEGTAADRSFARYRLEYALAGGEPDWNPIAPPSPREVFGEAFQTWIPPGPGVYLVRLSTEDRAGNVRTTTQRVYSADTPVLTDFNVSPELFSPNGDGVLDETLIRYRLLEPANLEFTIVDDGGAVVRTFSRSHPAIGEYGFVWDGRNSSGFRVEDGPYRVRVLSYEQRVGVLTTPPALPAIRLQTKAECRRAGDFELGRHLRVTYRVEPFPPTFTVERGLAPTPASWQEASASGISISEATAYLYRGVVTDAAGNRSISQAEPPLPFVLLGATSEQPGGAPIGPPGEATCPLPQVVPVVPANGLLRLEVLESRAGALVPERIVVGPLPAEGRCEAAVLDTETFAPIAIYAVGQSLPWGSPAPDEAFEVLWNGATLPPGGYCVRIEGVDPAGESWASSRLEVVVEAAQTTLQWGGQAPEDRLTADSETAIAVLYRTALAAGAIAPGDTLVHLGEIVGGAPVAHLELIVSSDEDPRYALPRRLSPDFGSGSRLLFRQPLWEPCTDYAVRLEGRRLEADGAASTISSGHHAFQSPCFDVAAEVRPDWATQCDEAPSGDLLFELTPRGYGTQVGLALLTLGRLLPNGEEELWTSWNQPASGVPIVHRFDPEELAEGEYRFRARLVSTAGEERIEEGRFVVERSAPGVALLHPVEGQQLCLADAELRWHVSDDLELSCRSAISPPAGCQGGNLLFTACGPPAAWPPLAGARCGTGQTPIPQGHGPREVHFESVGWSGHLACVVRTVEIDGVSEGSAGLTGAALVSPNGDSVFDSTSLSVQVAETMTVRAAIHPAEWTSNGWAVAGPEVRRILDDVQVFDLRSAEWNGEDDDGVVVEDGAYLAVVTLLDGCTNRSDRHLLVEVDTTPPAVEIQYPRAGDPLPMVVTVRGSVADRHPGSFQLFAGAGADPVSWMLIGTGTGESDGGILGSWNTFGLAGTYTLQLVAQDGAGNVSEARETLVLDAPFRLLSYLEAVPPLFSPNADGRREESAIRFGVEVPAVVSVRVETTAGALVRQLVAGQLLDPGAQVSTWTGLTTGGVAAPDAEYRVRVDAVLAANENVTQSETVPLVLDRTAPLIELTRPAAGFVSGTGSVIGTIADAHFGTYTVELAAGSTPGAWLPIDAGSASRHDAPLGSLEGLDEGAYRLRLRAEDLAEIRSERLVDFTIDNTPPVVTLESPAVGSVHSAAAGAVQVRGTVVEAHPASFSLEVGAGAAPTSWQEIAAGEGVPASPTLADWTIAALADGPYTLRLTARDRAALVGTATLAIQVDNTPPTATIDSPAPDGFVLEPIPILGSATDLNLAEYIVGVAPEGAPLFSEIARGSAPVAGGTLGHWTALPPDGRYRLRLDVVDGAGNASRAEVAVAVDTTPPSAPVLQATLENGDDARLSWTTAPEPDVVGYEVERDGVPLAGGPVVGTTALDPDLGDGAHRYIVRAIDRAGWRSEPSNEAVVEVDRTPPIVRLLSPADAERVSGLVELVGTATSAGDFRELRLFVTPLAGGAPTLLVRSSEPVEGGTLAYWSTTGLADESAHRLRLEADDLAGNQAADEIDVTIDNLPPAPPIGLVATVPGGTSDVALSWSPSEAPDLDGYLLYRDGALVNAAGGAPGDLRAFLIRGTTYLDRARPDGLFTYVALAMDLAGNLSVPSNEAAAMVSRHAPHAVIVEPVDGATIEGATQVVATTPDEDVVEVRFEFRPVGEPDWRDLPPLDAAAPWAAIFDPAALEPPLPFGDYELQAVARDATDLVDPGPTSIRVTYTELTAPAPPTALVARVDGGDVTLAWQGGEEPDLAGFAVERADGEESAWVRLTAEPIAATTYLDASLADAAYRYRVLALDGAGNESEPSDEAPALVHSPRLRQPYTPTEARSTALGGRTVPSATATVVATSSGGASEPQAVVADAEGRFLFAELALAVGDNALEVRVEDGDGNRSKPATVFVWSGDRPSAPTGLAAAPGSEEHEVVLAWSSNPEPDILGYRVRRNLLELPVAVSAAGLTAAASSSEEWTPPSAALDGDRSTYWAPAEQFVVPIAGQWIELSRGVVTLVESLDIAWFVQDELVFGAAAFDIEGWDGRAWVPLAEVRGNVAGEASVELARPYRTDRLRLVLVEAISEGEGERYVALAEIGVRELPTIAATGWSEIAPDGSHAYALNAWNELGFESDPSATATLDVGDTEPPLPVVLSAAVAGANVELSWTASASPDVARYDLYRDGAKFGEHDDLESRLAYDLGLANGTYVYAVRPVDLVGNEGGISNEVAVDVDVPPPPIGFELVVTEVAAGGALDLAWQAPAGAPPAAYRVYRSLAPSGGFTLRAEIESRTLRDTGLTNGVTYFYEVVAIGLDGGATARSNVASGTPRDGETAAPSIHFPTVPGIALEWRTLTAAVAGEAEPGAAVALYRNGAWVGATSTRLESAQELLPLSSWARSFHAAPDGRSWYWVDEQDRAFLGTTSGDPIGMPGASALWSWSGRSLWAPGGDGELAEIGLDGRVRRTISLAGVAWFAAASPGDRSLAVALERDAESGLYLLDLASGELTRLIEAEPWRLVAESVQWSPDGETLALLEGDPWNPRLMVVHLGAGAPWSEELDGQASHDAPSWAPDGGRLYWTSSASGSEQIWSWDRSGGAVAQVTDSSAGRRAPQPSRSGRKLATVDGDGRLHLLDLAGEGETEIFDFGDDADRPRLDWSRGGALFAFDSGRARRFDFAGRFHHPGIPLLGGSNEIAARATDVAGNLSALSAPIVLDVPAQTAPDLELLATDLSFWPQSPVAGSVARLSVTVRNAGASAAPATTLSLLLHGPGGELVPIASGAAIPGLVPGAARTSFFDVTLPPLGGVYRMRAAVDPDDQIAELDETNNQAVREIVVATLAGPAVEIASDRTLYEAGETVRLTTAVTNAGPVFSGRVRVRIEDGEGFEVAALLDQAIVELPYGGTLSLPASWPVGEIFAGAYQARAELVGSTGEVVGADLAAFEVGERFELFASIETDRASYVAGEPVGLRARFAYPSGNAVLTGFAARIVVLTEAGAIRREWTVPLAELLPGASGTIDRVWGSSGEPPGAYGARVELVRGDVGAASAATLFALLPTAPRFTGTLALDPESPTLGEPVRAAWSVRLEAGAPMTGALARLSLVDPPTGEVVEARDFEIALATGETESGVESFSTASLALRSYLVVLALDLDGGGSAAGAVPLALASFATADRVAPRLTVLRPEPEGLLGGALEVVASAIDDHSSIDRVETSVDQSAWVRLSPIDAPHGLYARPIDGLAEGAHALVVRAFDVWENARESGAIPFVVDRTPPAIVIEGVVDGGSYPAPVTPVVTVTDPHPGWTIVNLDQQLFESGTEVAGAGPHALRVIAEDAAGNRAEASVSFTLTTPGLPELAATKIAALAADHDGDGVPSPGDEIEYTLTLGNLGSSPATGVVLTDPWPELTVLVEGSISSDAGEVLASEPVTVAIAELPVGDVATIRFRSRIVPVVPPGTGSISNQAVVTATGIEPVLSDDPAAPGEADPTETPIEATPRLHLAKSDQLVVDANGDGLASPGDELLYVLDLENDGSTAALAVELTDPLPAFAPLVPGSLKVTGGEVTSTEPLSIAADALAVGARVTASFRVRIASDFPASELGIANQATAVASGVEPVLSDDPATPEPHDPTRTEVHLIPLISISDVEVSESAGAAELAVALSRASNRPTRFAFASADASAHAGADYQAVEGVVTIPAGELGGSIGVILLPDTDVEGTETFAIELSAPENGELLDAVAIVTILDDDGSPALAASKSAELVEDDGDGELNPGERLRYRIDLAATGESRLSQLRLTDPVPLHAAIVPGSVTTTAGFVAGEDPIVVEIGELEPGGAATITFEIQVAAVDPPLASAIVNQGIVDSAELPRLLTDDPAVGGAADPTVVPLIGRARLSAIKVDSLIEDAALDGPSAGDRLEYRITLANEGGGTARAVRFEDMVPENTVLEPESVWASAGEITEGATIVVEIGDVPGGGLVEIGFHVRIATELAADVTEIANQGSFHWGDSTLLTDDPDLPGADDVTTTELSGATILEIPTFGPGGAASLALALALLALSRLRRETRRGSRGTRRAR